jgi:hypothetical protein
MLEVSVWGRVDKRGEDGVDLPRIGHEEDAAKSPIGVWLDMVLCSFVETSSTFVVSARKRMSLTGFFVGGLICKMQSQLASR